VGNVGVIAPTSKRASQSTEALSRELQRQVRLAGDTAGVFVIHLESGREAGYKADMRLPMASLSKIPLAVEVLSRVDFGSLNLDTMLEVEAKDLAPGSGLLQIIFKQPRVTLSVLSLMELMLVASDNSAGDILLKLVGGTDAVNARMRLFGFSTIRLDRSAAQLIADFDADANQFASDFRDNATAEDLTRLLAAIWQGKALQQDTASLLRQSMGRCQTGADRLAGLLPRGTEIAHKTGSMVFVANDMGIITLPDHTHIAITVLSKRLGVPDADRDRTIAEIARTSYDYFLFVD
jgi:beta-lactamase class A